MILPLELTDAQALAQIHKTCFPDGWSEAAFYGLLHDSTSVGWKILDQKENIAGFILARIITDEGEILTIAVHPSYQRQGLGSRLVQALQIFSEEVLVKKLHLEVAVDNVSAIALYNGSGFDRTGFRPDYYKNSNHESTSAYIMSWAPKTLPEQNYS